MSNPKCAVCGHISRVGATACEMCDTRFDAAGAASAADPFGTSQEPFGNAAEPGWSGAEPRWSEAEPSDAYGEEQPAGEPPLDVPAPHFKSVGDVFAPTLEVYRKNFVLIGIIVLVTMMPVALLQYGLTQAIAVTLHDGLDPANMFSLALATNALVWLLSVVGGSLLSGALVYAVIDIQRTGTASAAECLRRGLKTLPKVFVVSFLYSLMVFVGCLLLVVPGIIFSLMFAVAVPAAVLENRGPIEALGRSATLTSGFKGLIFLTYFLWGLLIFVLLIVVTWSFSYSNALEPLPMLLVLSAVTGILNSSKDVLTVYIYLGLLNERAHGFDTHTFTPGPEAAAR